MTPIVGNARRFKLLPLLLLFRLMSLLCLLLLLLMLTLLMLQLLLLHFMLMFLLLLLLLMLLLLTLLLLLSVLLRVHGGGHLLRGARRHARETRFDRNSVTDRRTRQQLGLEQPRQLQREGRMYQMQTMIDVKSEDTFW